MASPLTPLTLDKHQIEAVKGLLLFMAPESIMDYAKARDALGKGALADRFKAIKELRQDELAMAIQTAQTKG
jgi:hypothetical protein